MAPDSFPLGSDRNPQRAGHHPGSEGQGFQDRGNFFRSVAVRHQCRRDLAGKIARLAGVSLEVLFSKGSLIVLSQRLVNTVINRCRPPSSGDILVPNGPALILGTTSKTVEEIESPVPDEEEVDLLISEGEKMAPEVAVTRAIRAYAGVRPLMGAREGQEDGREISPGLPVSESPRNRRRQRVLFDCRRQAHYLSFDG